VTGKLDYSTDHVFEGKLYAAMLGSPYPHAKITAIDTSAAMALPGVKAVTTYLDCPIMTQELFYVGQEVCGVAATDPHIASQALLLVKVTYSVLPFVTNIDAAITNNTLTGLIPNTNEVGEPLTGGWGDVNAGFAASDVTVEDTIGMSASYQHSTLEPRSCIAVWDDILQDQLTIYTDCQNPFSFRSTVAGALNIPLENVTIITHGTGGAFGDLNFNTHNVVAAVLAKKAGAPVQYHLSRKQNYLSSTQQYADRGDIKLGAKSDGTLMAIQATFWTDIGAFPWPAVGDAISPLQITFNVPNASFTGHTITTNKPQGAYWRCVGEPGGLFDMEPVIEQLCVKLNMDPVQFRLKNVKTMNDTDNGSLGLNAGQSGLPFSSMALAKCIQDAANSIGWTTKWHAPGTKVLSDGRYHGIGISGFVCNKGTSGGDIDCAIINSTTDGGFFLNVGISSIQDTVSALTYLAAEAIGVSAGDVRIGAYGDTSVTQNCGGQGGSTRCITTGAAVLQAGLDVQSQLFAVAAPMLKTTPDKLSAKLGNIFVTGTPTQSVTVAAVLAASPNPIVGRGYNTYPTKMVTRTTCATAAEVAVDEATGAIEVLDMVTADDVGTSLTHNGTTNQIMGGAVQSLGYALMWSWFVDDSVGVPMNPSFLGHRFPTQNDFPTPDNFTAIIEESYDKNGPLGVKGLGEPPLATPAAAIVNAIYNATGKWVRSQPATPWAVLKALGKSQ
jgi:CO/xanthine dehydrogenase Mo-binding subunit